MAEKLADLHLADLHARAAELGVPRFRLLRREQLVREIETRGGGGDGEPPETGEAEAPAEAPSARVEAADEAERGRGRERLRQEETEEVAGVLEIMPQRFGLLRTSGLGSNPEDVYVSAAQVKRCELRPGDQVSGPARAPRRGERHRALVHVDLVNGADLEALEDRPRFDQLTPVLPRRPVALDRDPADVLVRAVDLLAPVVLGQRVLIRAAPRSGRTTLLRSLAGAIGGAGGIELLVLLVDERPEEATAWRLAVPEAEIAVAPAELAPAEQVAVAELALERARRRVEGGADLVLIVDSLSRLAVAADGVAEVKRLFGSGRDLGDEAGSLTVVATVLEGADDDGAAERAVITTESSLIELDPALAAAGVVPALNTGGCRISNEDQLRSADQLEAVRRLRSMLAELDPAEAAALLRERIEASGSNAELLSALG
jgi:transcription termination factor Rho